LEIPREGEPQRQRLCKAELTFVSSRVGEFEPKNLPWGCGSFLGQAPEGIDQNTIDLERETDAVHC